MYQVLYRKYRPRTFDDVAGQEHITTTLKNEVAENRISHAYLFTGSRGTGKTSCAKILSKAVNCLNPQNGNPCCECEICRGIDNGSIMDVVEMDAASNRKIDNIRDIIDEVQFKPAQCRYRVYIIDEVHMLTTESFNALLKNLEEPPEHAIFILATTEVHKVMLTIQSRCQRFDFHRISLPAMTSRLLYVANCEKLELSESAAALIASVSDGAMRDALSLLDRCAAIDVRIDENAVRAAAGLTDKSYLFDLAECVINKNTARALETIDRLYSEAKDMARLCDELTQHFRALLLIKSVRNPENLVIMTADEFERARTQADYLSVADVVYFMDVLSRAYQRMGSGTGDRTELEMAMVKLSSPELDVTNEAVAARLTALERAVKKGIAAKAVPLISSADLNPAEKPGQHAAQEEQAKPAQKNEKSSAESSPLSNQTEQEKPAVQPEPARQRQPQKRTQQELDDIYRNAVPFTQWSEVIEGLKPVSRTIAAAFSDSTAYVSGDFLLIDSSTETVFELLRHSSQKQQVKDVVQELTGKRYKFGPYKRPQSALTQAQSDPLDALKSKLKENGIDVTEQ